MSVCMSCLHACMPVCNVHIRHCATRGLVKARNVRCALRGPTVEDEDSEGHDRYERRVQTGSWVK